MTTPSPSAAEMHGSDSDYSPEFQTARFDVFHHHVTRNPSLGLGRDVYTAWFRDKDVPRSVCEITLWGNYVEWIHVCETYRRHGIGLEVFMGLQNHVGFLESVGVTDPGISFMEAVEAAEVNIQPTEKIQ